MDLDAGLRRHFGHETFRPGQREVIEAVLSGRDALAVHPTGAGKSLMYQLPAVLREGTGGGLALVVSPLIALMQDQVDGLRRRGISAAFVNSTLSAGERREVWQAVHAGQVRLLYAAPEQFDSAGFAERIGASGCWLLVVDEAHCISQWGHDFRPDYARIGNLLTLLAKRPAILAVTATATTRVRGEIVELLAMRDPLINLGGIYRPNLRIAIRTDAGRTDRVDAILKVASWSRDSGGSMIVYAGSRDRSESIAAMLSGSGHAAAAYHAGLDAVVRATRQDRFNAGQIGIMVATNAFGMGIDKQDIRAVVHWRLPESLEGYYQEIGRAGRDGRRSLCLGFFGSGDVGQLEFMVRNNNPFPSQVESEYRTLRELAARSNGVLDRPYDDLPRTEATSRRIVCNFLARFGAVQNDYGRVVVDPSWPGLSRRQREWMDTKREADMARLAEVESFANEHRCRMLGLQDYFGFAELRQPCGHCDVCKPVESRPTRRKRAEAAMARFGRKVAKRPPVLDAADAAASDLFEQLRAWRSERADGKPAFTVCGDRTLIDIARLRPRSMAELAGIHGIGPARLEAYGPEILAVVERAG